MKLEGDQKLVRIFIDEADRWKGRPLYEALLDEAKTLGLAGATVLKGVLGYGRAARMHSAKLLELSHDMPVVVEVVDSEANVRRLLPRLDAMVAEGLVTVEDVHVLLYRSESSPEK